ncbi:MAG TPA: OmpA family protein [Kofleriaceae bacterium]|nr:OmpA family protein [Kofleriaceae bacterium]
MHQRATRGLIAIACVSVLATAVERSAHAQAPAGNIDMNQFRPANDSRGYITVNASQVLGDGDISFGLGALDWGHTMLHFQNGQNDYAVKDVIAATIIAAYGMKFGKFELEAGLSAPFVIMNGDRGPDYIGDPNNPNDDLKFGISGQGFGNIGIHLKTRFLKTSLKPHIGLGVIVSAYLPTASPKDKWLGEGQLVPQALVVLDKEFGAQRELRLALNAGIRIRPKQESFTDNVTTGEAQPIPTTGQTITAQNEIPVGAGIAYAISPQKFDVVAEVTGAIPISGATNYFPLEAIGGVKLYLARNSFLSLGGGAGLMHGKGGSPDARAFIGIVFEPNIGDRDNDTIKDDVDQCPDNPEDFDDFEDEDGCPDPDNDRDGIPDVDDKCPNVPETKNGFEDEDGCPDGVKNDRDGDGITDDVDQCPDDPEDFDKFQDQDGCPDPDNDQDGIPDVDDLCPNDPEDKDGWEDEDGCPDPDNDKDRILDNDDKCPNEPETYNGVDDDDGCPDRGRVVVTDTKIEILDKVYFEYNKAVIKKESYPILDAVAATLQGNPDIQLIEVQGHTDERGDDAYNLDLSQKRAHAVLEYLTGKGVDESRLQSQGYGETQPIDRRHNEEAWAKNRRVEFLILKRSGDDSK